MNRTAIIGLILLTLCIKGYAQTELSTDVEPGAVYKGALGAHPLTNSMSWRTNKSKKHFMDYRLAYNLGNAAGIAFLNFEASAAFMWRRKQSEYVNFSWGIGASLATMNPGLHAPLDIEFFPIGKAPQLSIGAQATPSFLLKKSTELSFSTTIQTDFTIRYYFEKKS